MRGPALLLALAATSMSSGCVAVGAAAVAGAGMVAVQDRSVGRAIDDTTSATEVKTRLMAVDSAAYARLMVSSAEGTLLMSGTVPSMEHKAIAERVAWSINGIEDVANEIEVGRNRGVLRTGLDNVITTEVRAKVLADSQIKGVNYNIATQKGVVYLMGTARSDEELQRTAQTASMVRGVERVVSYVVVRERNQRALPVAQQGAAIEMRGSTAGAYAFAPSSAPQPAAASPAAEPYAMADYGDTGSGAPLLGQNAQ